MNEPEVRKVFMLIQNTNGSFDYDDDKVEVWVNLLRYVPFDLAQRNLREHLLTNQRIPVPADLAKPDPQPEQLALYHGHLKDSAKEYIAQLDSWKVTAVPPPEEARERMRQLAERHRRD